MNILKTTIRSLTVIAGLSVLVVTPASAVFFHLGSGSIDGSLCVGFDCPASPAFGFDTIRIQENNLRFHFEDTSVAASFPRNDWRLTANDSANGGSSHFSIEDATAGRFVFRVFAGARSNALTVDSQGDVGLGTTTPATDIDIKTGDTPTLRLQQDGTSGFTPQTWDLAGNETNFFIRDATGGSKLPFRIRPGAATDALGIGSNGNVGIGTSEPADAADLHIKDADNVVIRLDDTTNPNNWQIANVIGNTELRLSRSGTGGVEMALTSAGDMTVRGNYFSTACPSPTPCAPDFVFEDGYELMPLTQLAEFVKLQKHLPNVPSAQDLIGPINMTEMQMTLLEKVEELTLYTLAQEEQLSGLRDEMATLRALVSEASND